MAAAHAAGRTLQWMRSAPKTKTVRNTASDIDALVEELDGFGGDFLGSSSSSHHFKVLDRKGLEEQQEAIDDAARQLLARRKKRPTKAWGAPAKTENDYKRSLVPRSGHGARAPKPSSPTVDQEPDYDALNYAFMPEAERTKQNQRLSSKSTLSRRHDLQRGRSRANPSVDEALESIPSDFVQKLQDMRNVEAEKATTIESNMQSPAKRADDDRADDASRPIREWTKSVREAFVKTGSDRPSPIGEKKISSSAKHQKDRKGRRPASALPRRHAKNKATVATPFAGVEARSMVSHMSRSMERTMQDLREKEKREAAVLRHKWHAKPVPQSVKENRYQEILDRQEAKRLKASVARKERLMETLKPFPGLELREKELAERRRKRAEKRRAEEEKKKADAKHRKERQARAFRAAAAKSAAAQQDAEAAAVRRRANIQRRANKLMHSARMPARMEMWSRAQRQKAKTESKDDDSGSVGRLGKTQPLNKVSQMPGGEIKKYFERSQRRFKKELQKARQSRPKAPARPFSFMSKERLEQEELRRKKTEERIRRQAEQDERDSKAHENRMKKLAKKLKSTKQVSCFDETILTVPYLLFKPVIFIFMSRFTLTHKTSS